MERDADSTFLYSTDVNVELLFYPHTHTCLQFLIKYSTISPLETNLTISVS